MSEKAVCAEHKLISQLDSIYRTGNELLGLIYTQRSLSRSITNEDNPIFSAEYCKQLCVLFENEFLCIRKLNDFQRTFFGTLRTAIQCLATSWVNHGQVLTHTDMSAAVVRNIGLLHIIDSVKHNKRSLYKDVYLFENFMQTVMDALSETDTSRKTISARLDEIKKIRTFLATRWSLLNTLLTVLSDVSRAPSVFASLAEFITRALGPKADYPSPVFLAHERTWLLNALPVTLYLNHFLNKKSLIDEMISPKVMESCFKLLRRYPVVPGIGDNSILLYVPILGIQFTQSQFGKEAKRHQVTSIDEFDSKTLEHLEMQYSLKMEAKKVRDMHDHMCETISLFIRDSEKWKAVQGRLPPQVYDGAVELVYRTLDNLSRWRSMILELFAWRKSAPTSKDIGENNDIPNQASASAPANSYKRVRRPFQNSDIPAVLEVMMCVKGLADYLYRVKDCIIPYVYEWTDRAVQRFLEVSEKRCGYIDSINPRTVFFHIQMFKEQVQEGKSVNSESVKNNARFEKSTVDDVHELSDQERSKRLVFDCRDIQMISELKRKTEELHHLCNSAPGKSKLTSLICGAPHLLAPGLLKTTRDLLKELYIITEVLKVDEHLKSISDFSDLALREIEIEMFGIPNLDENYCIVSQLARGAVTSPLGGSLIPVLDCFDIFESASQRAIRNFNSAVVYLEIRERAFHSLENLFDEICMKAISYGKHATCISLLGLDPCAWISENAMPRGISHRFDEFFQKRIMQLAGCDIDIQSILIHKLNRAIHKDIIQMFKSLDEARNPSMISEFNTRIGILKGAHEWLSNHVSLIPWEDFFDGNVESEDCKTYINITRLLLSCVKDRLFEDYYFEMKSRKFRTKQKKMEEDPQDLKLNTEYWRESIDQICDFGNLNDVQSFSLKDIVSLCNLLNGDGIGEMVEMVQDYIQEGLLDFLSTELERVIQSIPVELLGLRPTAALGDMKASSVECLSWLLSKLGCMTNDVVFWERPMRKLEYVGNALVFLYMVEVALKSRSMTTSLGFNNRSLSDISNFSTKRKIKYIQENPKGHGHRYPSPFEYSADMRGSGQSPRYMTENDMSQISPMENNRLIKECIRKVQQKVLQKTQKFGHRIENAVSAILFVKTFLQGNSHFRGSFLGDGVVWASQVLIGMTGRFSEFESTDWTLDIVSVAEIDGAQNCFQASNDVKLFFKNATKAAESWWHLSRLTLFDPQIKATVSKTIYSVEFTEDTADRLQDSEVSSYASHLTSFPRDPPLPRFCNIRPKDSKKSGVRHPSTQGPLRSSLTKLRHKNDIELMADPYHGLSKSGYSNMDPVCDFSSNIMMSFDNNPFKSMAKEEKAMPRIYDRTGNQFFENSNMRIYEGLGDFSLGRSLHSSFITRTTDKS